ncbi:MAG: tape measure protein [Clostridiales bacterium]|nr:tape measure protein [Clostridiales bacterium]
MTVEELQVLITANTDNLRKEIQNTNKMVGNLEKQASKSSGNMVKAVLKGNIATKLLATGISLISRNMDDAITRLDALNNFPRVMSNLGISEEDAQKSMTRLSDALVGLPTTLDDATMSVQRFTSANGNVKASTEMFLALNNAILSGGADMQTQKSALEQLSQAYAKGKPDMMEWRTAMTAMPAQLKQVGMAMGYADASQLGEALRTGKVSMDEFMVTMTKLNKQGVNGFASFEEQARNSTGGVSTSMLNVKTAITRGLAEIMNAIGQSNIAGFFQGIAKAINSVIPYITGFVKACVWAVSSISSLFGGGTKKKIDETNKSLTSLGTSGGTTSKGLDKATGSAKKLNKELHGLASFDEMNVLKEQDDSSSGGGGDTGGGGAVGGDLSGIDLSGFDKGLSGVSSKADQVAEHLKGIFGSVGQILANVWSSEPMQAFVDFSMTYGQFLFDYWTTLGTSLWENLQMTWSNIELDVSTILTNMSLLWTAFWTDLSVGIQTWGTPIISGVNKLFNSMWKDALDPAIKNMTKAWADFSGILLELWNEHGKPLIDNIGEFAVKTIALFQKIWDDVLNPIITPFLETLSWLWDKHLKGLVKEIGNFIASLVNGALEIYNKFIQPIIMYLIDKLAPAWAYISNLVVGIMGTILGVISDVVGGIIKVLRGIIDFIVGVFTGNWQKAWDGVKSIFTGIWDALTGVVKGVINAILDVLNSFIAGINKIKFDVPDWVPVIGGKKWGFNIPKIPKLAQGGIVDKPTTALIGEAGREAIVPLDRNTEGLELMADRLADKLGNAGSPIQLVVKIGEDTILDKVIDGVKEKSFETNGEVSFSL